MASTVTVAQGDCISSIASANGFSDWTVVWNDPNNSDLRAKRASGNVLLPGDQVYVPDLTQKSVTCATDASYKFQWTPPSTTLSIKLADGDSAALASKPYRLTIDDGDPIDGQTDGGGLVTQPIPATAAAGMLLVWLDPADAGDDTKALQFPLSIGALDPHDEISGAQARLTNLGFGSLSASGTMDDDTTAALEQFQLASGLDVTGLLDDPTKSKLLDLHDGG